MSDARAFILAAGLGERLRPITLHMPKSLVPISGKPPLERALERISGIEPSGIGVNASYKKEAIEDWIRHSAYKDRITFFPEDPVLGTGGALKNAEGFLEGSDFLVHNADIISDIDLAALIEFHKKEENLATLAVHDSPEFNNLALYGKGLLKGISTAGSAAFTGIAVYSPEFLKLLPHGASSVTATWLKAIDEGLKIAVMYVKGCYWTDIGTPARYASALFYEMRREGENVHVSPASKGCGHAGIDGYVSIEGDSEIEEGSYLRNVIVLPGGRAEAGKRFENSILGPSFKIGFDEAALPGFDAKTKEQLIGVGGSGRKYFRTEAGVFLKCSPGDAEFDRQIEYTDFFRSRSVPVPAMLDSDRTDATALFEDLGDITLYSRLNCRGSHKDVEEIYGNTIDALVVIHSISMEDISQCPLLKERVFDYVHLRWETSYFIEMFVRGIRGIELKGDPGIEDDFHRLAMKADSFPKGIVHRDYQSQNIMIKDGEARVIDYQGARVGPQGYDLASLLWDPYYRLDESMRERLMAHYVKRMREKAASFEEETLRASLLPCRLQRHMQALGAYGKLATVNGMKYFRKHIPEGLRLLKEDISLSGVEYPALRSLIDRL